MKTDQDDKNKDRTAYHCAQCGAFITDSGAMVTLNGDRHHSYVNPSGIVCNFITFARCGNVVALENVFLEHSWFVGYGWRFLVCSLCMHHLGWKYDAVSRGIHPGSFFGVLIEAVEEVAPAR